MRSLTDFHRSKKGGGKIVMMTAYDCPGGRLCEEAGVDVILVGDSLGMVVLGYDSTVPVTLEDMIHHSRAVRRGAKDTFILTDMPFLTYQISPAQALENAARLMREGGCDGVKLEGGAEIAAQVRALTTAGIPVCGHVGLTPQSATALGGYKVQARTAEAARKLLDDALALEAAGAFMIVVEYAAYRRKRSTQHPGLNSPGELVVCLGGDRFRRHAEDLEEQAELCP